MLKTLDALEPADAARVGGKAWNCARLKRLGFPVPDALVVFADADDEAIARIAEERWFDARPRDERYAVRSSGLSEDSAGHSFAGIHETRLNVARADLRAAIEACRASARSDRAAAYRGAMAVPESGVAVLVQRMIQPAVSGVAFTVDPVTGSADEIVVSAAPGLGVAVVDGAIEPEDLRIRKREPAPVASALLTPAHLDELAALLVAIERGLGAPQDVEWCFDGAAFWIVQSRPITARPAAAVDIEWTRANLAEVLPELTSPQALAAIEPLLNIAERRYMGRLIAPERELGPWIKSFCGRLYFNVTQARHVCRVTGTPAADVLRSIGHPGEIRREDEIAPRPPLLNTLKCLPDFLRVGGRYLRVARIVRANERRIAERLAAIAPIDPAALPDERLWQELDAWDRASPDAIEVVLLLAGVLFHERRLKSICARVGVPFEPLLHAHLAAGERSVSAQQAVDLVSLAAVARDDPRAAGWFRLPAGSVDDMRRALAGTAFLAAFERFLDQYGHRGIFETDWALPRFAEDPSPIVSAIRLHVRAPAGEERLAIDARAAAAAAALWSDFERRAAGWKRWLLVPQARSLLRTIKNHYVWRERCRSDMVRLAAVFRRWHLVLARRFVDRGWLNREQDYFLVRFDEIGRAVSDPSRGGGLRAIAAERAAEMERNRRIPMPLLMRESELPRLMRGASADAGSGAESDAAGDLRGDPVSLGSVEGDVVVILDPADFSRMTRGAILVTRATDPSWTPLFTLAAGVIVEVGGVLSHASTIAREYGIPALANVRRATTRLRTGERVELNATGGYVRRKASPP